MNIVYISKYAAIPVSGKPTRQYFLSKYLAALGNKVLLIYSNSNGQLNNGSTLITTEQNGNLIINKLNGPIIKLGLNAKRLWSWVYFELKLLKFRSALIRFSPDIIIVSSLSILTFIYGILLKKRYKIPLVLEIRDIYPQTLIELNNMSKWNPFIQLLLIIEKHAYLNADLIISPLESAHTHVSRRIGKEPKFKWIPMGVDLNLYSLTDSSPYDNITNDIKNLRIRGYFIVAYAGTIGKANALEEFLQVSLDEEIIKNKIYFLIFGDGPLLPKYKRNYAMGNIRYFPSLNKNVLPSILSDCNILVNIWHNIKLYEFGISPNKWIEYMLSARPILLCYNGTSKVFNDADCGWQICKNSYYAIKNEILRIFALPETEISRKGKNGYDYLKSHLLYPKLAKELNHSLLECIGSV